MQINKENAFDWEGGLATINSQAPESLRITATKSVMNCKDAVKTQSDKCEAAYEITHCMYLDDPEVINDQLFMTILICLYFSITFYLNVVFFTNKWCHTFFWLLFLSAVCNQKYLILRLLVEPIAKKKQFVQ